VNLDKVRLLLSYYEQGLIPTLSEHEVHPDLEIDSRENYLYFTLPVSINFQRSSPAMWQAALLTFNDPQTNYLFYPEKTTATSYEKIKADLSKYRLALQTNKHTEIWINISKTLHSHFDNDPRVLIEEAGCDVHNILETIQVSMKKSFPYLSGPKLSNYWLYILSVFTDAKLVNTPEISIIPDTHIIQSSSVLGLVPPGSSPILVANTWRKLLKGSNINPVQLHPVLWNWSRNNFLPSV
jgi:hypothetical protein